MYKVYIKVLKNFKKWCESNITQKNSPFFIPLSKVGVNFACLEVLRVAQGFNTIWEFIEFEIIPPKKFFLGRYKRHKNLEGGKLFWCTDFFLMWDEVELSED